MQLSELQDSVRSKADEQNSDFITDVEINRHLNQGFRLIHGKIAQRFTDEIGLRGTVGNLGIFSTVVGTTGYTIPATVKKIVAVLARFNGSTSDNDWYPVNKMNPNSMDGIPYYPPREGYGPCVNFGYEQMGRTLYFKPVPTEAFQVRLDFIPKFVKLALATDEPAIPDEFHELGAEYATIQCLRKSGETIYKESMDIFTLELQNMIETCEIPNQQGQTMTITGSP